MTTRESIDEGMAHSRLDQRTEELMAAFADSQSGGEDVRNAHALRSRIRELVEEAEERGRATVNDEWKRMGM